MSQERAKRNLESYLVELIAILLRNWINIKIWIHSGLGLGLSNTCE